MNAASSKERFDNVQVLYIFARGLVALNSRVGTNGAVWGEDFVLSDKSLKLGEVLHLTRANFMKVIERRRFSCPQLGQIVRKFCVRLAARRGILQHAQQAQKLMEAAAASEAMRSAQLETSSIAAVAHGGSSPTSPTSFPSPAPPRISKEMCLGSWRSSSPLGWFLDSWKTSEGSIGEDRK
eukprot:g25620.t1